MVTSTDVRGDASARRRGATRPGELPFPSSAGMIPQIAWGTVGLFAAMLAIFVSSTVLAMFQAIPPWATAAANAVAMFFMFIVMHEAVHYTAGKNRAVNAALGRAAYPFVSVIGSFPGFRFLHTEHHLHTNDPVRDPDIAVTGARGGAMLLRATFHEFSQVAFYVRSCRSRPAGVVRAELIESVVQSTLAVGFVIFVAVVGAVHKDPWLVLAVYLVPHRVAMLGISLVFDWLPHHGEHMTLAREDRYRATRMRVGLEWLALPATASQAYHAIHHLHPGVPLFSYRKMWRRNVHFYAQKQVPTTTLTGKPVDLRQYAKRISAR